MFHQKVFKNADGGGPDNPFARPFLTPKTTV
jgi:hypothetical protein